MSQSGSSVREVVDWDSRSRWLGRTPEITPSPEVSALVLLSGLLFSVMAFGNLAGLW